MPSRLRRLLFVRVALPCFAGRVREGALRSEWRRPDVEESYFFYDARGQRTTVINPRNNSTYFRHDLLGRQTHQIDALGGVAYMAYDEVGNRTLVLDPKGQGTYLTFDRLNRMSHSKDQALGITYMGYDARSFMKLRVDADGRASYFEPDNPGRVERQYHRTPVAGDVETAPSYFVYDEVGNLTLVNDTVGGLGTTVSEYDRVDRLKKKVTIAGAVYYGYDLSGLRTSFKDPDLVENVYVLDNAGRLSKEQLAPGETAYYTYDDSGLVLRRDMPGNVVIAYMHYDERSGRLSELKQKDPNELKVRAYTRNKNGAIERIDLSGATHQYFAYDRLDRLTDEIEVDAFGTNRNNYYGYDPAGNRVRKIDRLGPTTTDFTYDVRNLLQTESPGGSPTVTYDYDAAQRMLRHRSTAEASYFTFDQRGRIGRLQHEATSGPEDPIQYFSYSGANERVRIADGAGEAYWSHDWSKLVREQSVTGVLVARYRHNECPPFTSKGTLLQATFTNGPQITAVPRYDERGSVLGMLKANGEQPAQYDYDRFGVMTGSGGNQRERLVIGAPFFGLNGVTSNAVLSAIDLALPGPALTCGGSTPGLGLWLGSGAAGQTPAAIPLWPGNLTLHVSNPWCGGPIVLAQEAPPVASGPPSSKDDDNKGCDLARAKKDRGRLYAALGFGTLGGGLSVFKADYKPSHAVERCCREIRFVQTVRIFFPEAGGYVDSWGNPKISGLWQIDDTSRVKGAGLGYLEPFDPALHTFRSPNPPYYPIQTPWSFSTHSDSALMFDAGGIPGGAITYAKKDYEFCAICIEATPDAPPPMAGLILGCMTWGQHIVSDVVLNQLGGRVAVRGGRLTSQKASPPSPAFLAALSAYHFNWE